MLLSGKKIIVIDDTASIRTFLRISMEAYGASFYEANNAAQGIEISKTYHPDLIVLDLGLPDRDGLEILQELKNNCHSKLPVIIVLSVRKEPATKNEAMALGADGYMTKPFLMEDLLDIIEKHLQ